MVVKNTPSPQLLYHSFLHRVVECQIADRLSTSTKEEDLARHKLPVHLTVRPVDPRYVEPNSIEVQHTQLREVYLLIACGMG